MPLVEGSNPSWSTKFLGGLIMLNLNHLREQIVRPALKHIGLWSHVAENLVMGTGYQESRYQHLVQLGNGPAKGLWQMEPRTHDDIWSNFLKYRKSLRDSVTELTVQPWANEMVWNLQYAAAMCRVHYFRVPKALPEDTPTGLAHYWKDHYNTYLGKGTVEEFVKNYEVF